MITGFFRTVSIVRAAGLLALVLVTVAFSCRDPLAPADVLGSEDEIIVAFGLDKSEYPQDDWDLLEGDLAADTLALRVQYAGGCREHQFRLLAVDDWVELPDFGPTPTVGVPLLLSHDANGDSCEAALTATLRFGLEPLGQAYRQEYGSGPARLLLQITDGRDGLATHSFDWFLDG